MKLNKETVLSLRTTRDVDVKDKYVQRLKELYKKKTGKDISDAEALEHFEKLVTLVRAVYKPIPISQESENSKLDPWAVKMVWSD